MSLLITVAAVVIGVLVIIPAIVASFLRNVDAGTIRLVVDNSLNANALRWE